MRAEWPVEPGVEGQFYQTGLWVSWGNTSRSWRNCPRDTSIAFATKSSWQSGIPNADVVDPCLGLLKRQFLGKTTALLGEPLGKEVIFLSSNW